MLIRIVNKVYFLIKDKAWVGSRRIRSISSDSVISVGVR